MENRGMRTDRPGLLPEQFGQAREMARVRLTGPGDEEGRSDSVSTVTEEQLDTGGFSQYPYGSDPGDPFIVVLAGANLQFSHHRAEIAWLRDLWRARSATSG